jgi:hypothetical protein
MFLSKEEDLSLIQAAELHINIKVMFIEGLEARVEKALEKGVCSLFDHFSACFAGIVFGAHGAHAEDVHCVVGSELVV